MCKLNFGRKSTGMLLCHKTLYATTCQYSEFFWSVFSPNARKYGPEKLRIRTLFTHCAALSLFNICQWYFLMVVFTMTFNSRNITKKESNKKTRYYMYIKKC